jgi:hypothetical protein
VTRCPYTPRVTSPSLGPPDRIYRCALAVTLKKRGENVELLTSEVSFAGAFLRTTSPPPLHSLVRLLFTLPPDDAVLDLSAHITQIIRPTDDAEHYPGFAARFVALNGPVKRRWEALVQSVRNTTSARTLTFARPSYVMRLQLKEPTAKLRFRPSSFEELANLIEEQIPTGSFCVPTTAPVPLGSNVNVELVHPITEETLQLPGAVVRNSSAAPGTLVQLAPLDDQMRAAVKEFEDSVVVHVDYDVDLFDDPVLSEPGT